MNYHAVKLLVKLAKEYGIERFIHVGTANSFGFGSRSNPGNESKPYSSDRFGFDYHDSKQKAQEYLIHEARANDFPAIILNPTWMLGPYDSGSGSNRMILEIYRERMPGYSRGGRNYIHVKDVAKAAANAIHQGRLGECYIIGNRNMSYKEALRMIAETLGVRVPGIPFPKFLALTYGALNEFISRLTGSQPKLTWKMVRIGFVECYYTQEKAINELNLTHTPIEEAVMESYLWFKEKGQIE